MKKKTFIGFVALALFCGLNAFSQETTKETEKPNTASAQTVTSVKPEVAPDPAWTLVEEAFWFPLRYEPMRSFDDARYNYRRSEENLAAYEINKAVSWLGWAERHAMPETKAKLTEAATLLREVAKDLQRGDMHSAAKLDASLSKAASALSEWHYYRARDWWKKSDSKHAGDDLVLAANYLQRAADSAHYQFGPDTQKSVTEVFRNGKWINEASHADHNWIVRNIERVEEGLREIAVALKK